jgi:NADH-quinone oxidoreductase subunit M
MSTFPLITMLTLLPAVGAVLVATLRQARPARAFVFAINGATLLLALILYAGYDAKQGGLQWIEHAKNWVPFLGIEYYVAVDGLGVLMVVLSALVVPFGIAATRVEERVNVYLSLMLFLQAGLFGAFTALNFFHWFIFYEISLVPAYFLIKLWGGPARVRAATQFFVYTMVGSVAMLLGFVALFLATGSFDFIHLSELAAQGPAGGLAATLGMKLGWGDVSSKGVALIVFLAILLGFAVKVPMFPFHTWQPPAYAEAPTGVTMVLTGALSKMGLYGFLRILLPIFPEQMRWLWVPLLAFAVATIIFSALAALAQKDLKRIVAYSSMNHLGYCLLGIFAAARLTNGDPRWITEKAAALNGVLVQMFNHGIVAAAVFCFIGFLEQRSGGLRGLEDFGGLRRPAPILCGLMGIAVFALLGLPGLNGFVGEFLIFKGAFPLAGGAAVVSVIGLLLTAVFLLTLMQRVFHGPVSDRWATWADLSLRECLVVAPAVGLFFLLGLCPQLVVGLVNSTVVQWVQRL